jgi:ribonuclease BN (tRNA processing enzyme)
MLTILGGAGFVPAFGRHTACALLRDGERAAMIDAGTGVARLIERPALLDGVSRLDIVLTHFHLDHIAGLAYLPALGICEHTTLWGPGTLLYDIRTEAVLARVSREPVHPVALEQQDIEVRDIPSGELELDGTRVSVRRQDRHSAPSLALRFGDDLTWITDTAYDRESVAFSSGCRTLAHEAWFESASVRNADIHSSAAQAAEVAARAGCERLLLIHLPPFRESLDDLLAEARDTMPQATLALDGTEIRGL